MGENNLGLQQSLYHLRAETQEAFDEAKRLETRWQELEKEQKEVYQVRVRRSWRALINNSIPIQRFTPQFLLMRLRHSTTAQDEASEALASSFVQQQPSLPSLPRGETSGTGTPRGGLEVEEFIKEFKEMRKQYHKRAMWGEKWANGQVAWRED